MRILFVSEYYDPEGVGLKGVMFARRLQEKGHEVEVLTAVPNHPEGRIFPGYELRPWQRETIEGVPIIRVPLYPSHDTSPLRRLATYGSFALSAATIGAALVKKADVAYVYHPPGTIGLPLFVLRYLRRIRVVLDVQDLWPDIFELTGLANRGWIRRLVGWWMRRVYAAADGIIVLSQGFKERLVERGVPASKIAVVHNWTAPLFRPGKRDPELERRYGLDGTFNVVFAGTMGRGQDIPTVLKAAALLAGLEEIRFFFFGGGTDVESLRAQARDMGLRNVQFPGRVPPAEMARILPSADALLIHLRASQASRVWVPSKTQAYLAVGRPIISNVGGDTQALIDRSGGGLTVPPGDPEALAGAVRHLHALSADERTDIGLRAASFYENELSIDRGTDQILRVLEDVVDR